MKLTNAAILEISELTNRAERLARGDAGKRAESAVLLSRIKSIRDLGESSLETRRRYVEALNEELNPGKGSEERRVKAFHQFIYGGEDSLTREQRNDLTAGGQSISYSPAGGVSGGVTVPISTESAIRAAMAAIDPLLSSEVTDFVVSDNLVPTTISSYDLSSVSAQNTTETSFTPASSFVNTTANTLTPYTYRAGPYAASIEALDDVPDAVERLATLFGVSLGRGISQSAVLGNSNSDIEGILTAINTRVLATSPGSISYTSISDFYFSLNVYWRRQPKIAFLCHDSVTQRLRQIQDNSGRPVIPATAGDKDVRLFGAPIYTSPSMPAVNSSVNANGILLLGDFHNYRIRLSIPRISRSLQASTKDITLGQALFTCRAKVSAIYQDASNGVSPAIIACTVTA